MSTKQLADESGAETRSLADRLELTSYTRRDDGGTKASYLDPNDRTKSMVEIWIPFSGDDQDENGKAYLKRTTTLPAKINLIRGDDTDGATRERHLSEPQYAPSEGDVSYRNDSLVSATSSEPLYGTLRSQSSWKNAPHSITSLGSTMASPYDRYTLRDEERREKKKRRWPLIICCLALVILSILAVVLAVLLTTVLKTASPHVASTPAPLAGLQNAPNNSMETTETVARDATTAIPTTRVSTTNASTTDAATTSPPPTPVDGGWGGWSGWSDCDQPCGGGDRVRFRQCDSPQPQNGGRRCSGDGKAGKRCNTQPCPPGAVNGGWGNWGAWTQCSATCGGGHQVRQRLCNNPLPNHGGKNCEGESEKGRECKTQQCPRYVVKGVVRDATKNSPIKEASVTLIGRTTRTNDKGEYVLRNIPGGNKTLVASAPKYAVNSRRIVVQSRMPAGAADILLSPIISEDGFRVVLTWGNDPVDLDLYVVTPYSGCRVYYNNLRCRGQGDSKFTGELDVDDQDGFGPETITLREPYCGDTYVVYVGIFSFIADPKGSFTTSQATVQLFNSTTLVETVYVPLTGYDRLWQFWHVLNIVPGRKNGVPFTLVNKVQKAAPSSSLASQMSVSDRRRSCRLQSTNSDGHASDSDSDSSGE